MKNSNFLFDLTHRALNDGQRVDAIVLVLDVRLGEQAAYKYVLALFLDKEEIGSEGNTSARSVFLEDIVADIFKQTAAIFCQARIISGIENAYLHSFF